MTSAQRAPFLSQLRRLISARSQHIVEVLTEETGKPPLDALAGDVLVTLEQMRYYERHGARVLRTHSVGKPAFLYRGAQFYEQREPHGVVLIFSPSNYPFQLAVVPLITALHAGNAAILKCSERTPRVARLIATLCADAAIPNGLVQVVDDAPESATGLIDAGPDLIFFTGSSEHGKAVAKRAADRLLPTILELGGKDAALIFADCDIRRTLEGITYGAFSNAGQVCVGIKRAYVEEPIYEDFCHKLAERVGRLRVGTSADSDLGVLQQESARSNLVQQIEEALSGGATLIYPKNGAISSNTPIVLTDVPNNSRLIVEETFGPVLCVAPFIREPEAIALANSTPFALSASVWTRDLTKARRVATAMMAGSCAINDVIRNIANPYASFGGNRVSGYGRYHGPEGLLAFTRSKTVMIAKGGRHEIHWFPFRKATYSRLKALLTFRHGGRGWRNVFKMLVIAALFWAGLLSPAKEPFQPHLTIKVTTPATSRGSLAYLLFSSPEGFPNRKDKAIRSGSATLSIAGQTTDVDAGRLSPGRYAVSVYQDENGNHKLDSNIIGIPKEPVGASNNPKPRMGPPRFDDCAFQMKDTDLTISVTLVKP
jgi:acyl-CoA reductase-like NAD-dependent aldehyde dehydrogenase/uncharacterized protein (DUF2141 family)